MPNISQKAGGKPAIDCQPRASILRNQRLAANINENWDKKIMYKRCNRLTDSSLDNKKNWIIRAKNALKFQARDKHKP